MPRRPPSLRLTHRSSKGTSLIEVLMSIIVVSFGLLGLAALQGKATNAEMESYQRAQALLLLHDMVNRIENNPDDVTQYVTATPLGTGSTENCTAPATSVQIDRCEWSALLSGTSETRDGQNVGAMIEARGCVESTAVANQFLVAVVWQGVGETTAPTTTQCANGAYSTAATRRAVTATIHIPDLTGA